MVDRFGVIKRDAWTTMKVRPKDVNKQRQLEAGTVMFPTTHDITPSILKDCMVVLEKLLDAGNNVLIVSKPHMECIKAICERFAGNRKQILFRFTIGAYDNNILKYWEPNAPAYEERLECLKYAYYAGFGTSVSAEPLLDAENVVEFVKRLDFYITDSIWVGHMNKTSIRVQVETSEDQLMLDNILKWQTKEKTIEIYNQLKSNPKIKWKESIKQIVGIDLLTEPGLDK
jgi:DNA repair photolyase